MTTQHNGEDELEKLLDAHAEVYCRNTMRFIRGEVTEDERDKEFHHSDLKTKKVLLKREQSLSKAYGGCTNCYGKGYATVNDAWHGYDTDTDIGSPGGYVSGGDRNAMKFCSCNRGKQLEKMLAKHSQSLTKSLLAEMEERGPKDVAVPEETGKVFFKTEEAVDYSAEVAAKLTLNATNVKWREIIQTIRQERLGTKEEN